jgi:predicted nucleic acid-binding protein
MNKVFVDTVGMLAIWNRSDQWHEIASRAYSLLDPRNTLLYSTTLVLAECANAAVRMPFRADVDDFRRRLEATGTLIWISSEDWQAAWTAYREGRYGQAGLVDQVSFVIMKRLDITRSFSNDRHFHAAGFETLF